MTSRIPLPPGLSTGAFTTRAAARHGIGEGRLRGPDLARPFHGIRSRGLSVSLTEHCRALQLRLPDDGFFCGVTAARIMGMPLPVRLTRMPELHVGMPSPRRACKAAGTIGHKLQLGESDTGAWLGLRVTTPARTWCDLAAMLDIEDLVAAGDYLIHHAHPIVSRVGLAAAVACHPARRGRARLVEALSLIDDRAESAPESIVRVTVARAGIAGLVANYPIADAHGRQFARGDLCFPAHRVIFEYQGDYHRSEPDRWRKDRTRAARLAAAGWHIVEIAADELIDRRMLLSIVRDTLALYPARFAVSG